MRQGKDKSFEEFGQRVRVRATRAYPTANADIFEILSREVFFEGCIDPNVAKL